MLRTLTLVYSLVAFVAGVTAGYVVLGAKVRQAAPIIQPAVSPPKPTLQFSITALLNASTKPRGYHTFLPIKPHRANTGAASRANTAQSFTPIPMWNYSVAAGSDLGGGTYSGTIVGRSPFDKGKTTTTITMQIVPLIITIDNGSSDKVKYDPTVTDPCVTPSGLSGVNIVLNSPIFTNHAWNLNGVSQGNTQYIDAFQRAEFDTLVGGTPYHLILNPTVLAAQTLTFGSHGTLGPGSNFPQSCGSVGVVDINAIDNEVNSLITSGPLASIINAGTFPIFMTSNVVFSDGGSCCILGYHSGLFDAGNNVQIYSPFCLDTLNVFGGDVSALSHEIGEAINDPIGNNFTPAWGNIGQVSGCQNNLEVGDPLSGHTQTILGANGFNYHVQEMAFFSWFYGGTSLGAGGKFSSNGTFGGDAILCSKGGGTH